MKKIIALVVAVLMMAAIAVPTFAAWDTEANVKGNVTEVTFGVNEGYVISIPTAVDFGTNLSTSTTITASKVVIAGGTTLKVTVVSTQYDNKDDADDSNDTWILDDRTGSSDDVPYMITVDENNVVSGKTVVLSVGSAAVFDPVTGAPIGNSGSATITFTTKGTSQVGIYNDTLTFSAVVE